MNVPRREAVISLVLLALIVAALLLAAETPGPGPLALFTTVVAVHAALLAPALANGGKRSEGGAWAFLPALVALPALGAVSYGHGLPLGATAIVLLACAGGWAGRGGPRLYLPTMLLVFFAPYALAYLGREFGAPESADTWLSFSPVAAAHAGGWPPAACVAAMAAWPVIALAIRARRGGPGTHEEAAA